MSLSTARPCKAAGPVIQGIDVLMFVGPEAGICGLLRSRELEHADVCRVIEGLVFWGFRVPEIRGTFFWGPRKKDYSILGSILGSPYSGKLPYFDVSHSLLVKRGLYMGLCKGVV